MGKSLKINFILVAISMMCLCLFAISFLTLYMMSNIIEQRFDSIGKSKTTYNQTMNACLIIEYSCRILFQHNVRLSLSDFK